MKHIVYISPDCELFEHIDALAHEAAIGDQGQMLKSLAHHEGVIVFKEAKDFILAFNDETVSSEGYLLYLDDGLNGKDYILAMLKRKVRELLVNNANPNDSESMEIPVENTSVLPCFPIYVVVRANEDNDYCEAKIQKIFLRRNNVLTVTLENGIAVDAYNLFIENLRTLYDVLDSLNPRDNAIIQALTEQNDCGYYSH